MDKENHKLEKAEDKQVKLDEQGNKSEDGIDKLQTKPWYKKTWVIILALVLFFPLGLLLTWLSDWKLSMKILATGIVIVLFSLLIYSSITAKPLITVNSPNNGQEIETESIDITGNVNPAWSKLQVNDMNVELKPDGTFSSNVKLQQGQNTIKLSAINSGKTTELTVGVKRLTAAEIAARKVAETPKQATPTPTEKELSYSVISENKRGTLNRVEVYTTETSDDRLIKLNDKLLDQYKPGLTILYIDYFNDKTVASDYFSKQNDPNISEAEKDQLYTHYIANLVYNTNSGLKELVRQGDNQKVLKTY